MLCRLCEDGDSGNDILLAAVGQKLPGRTVMLQATGSSYFAFEPFLKALQRNQPLPLADHITRPPADAGNNVPLSYGKQSTQHADL